MWFRFYKHIIKVCVCCCFCSVLAGPTRNTSDGVLENLNFQKQGQRWGWGPLKLTVTAQKAFQASNNETRELLGGTKENSVSRSLTFFTERKQIIFELVATPGQSQKASTWPRPMELLPPPLPPAPSCLEERLRLQWIGNWWFISFQSKTVENRMRTTEFLYFSLHNSDPHEMQK